MVAQTAVVALVSHQPYEFDVGDVVFVTDHPELRMTVNDVSDTLEGGQVGVIWFDGDNDVCLADIHYLLLEKVPK